MGAMNGSKAGKNPATSRESVMACTCCSSSRTLPSEGGLPVATAVGLGGCVTLPWPSGGPIHSNFGIPPAPSLNVNLTELDNHRMCSNSRAFATQLIPVLFCFLFCLASTSLEMTRAMHRAFVFLPELVSALNLLWFLESRCGSAGSGSRFCGLCF